MKIGIVSYFSNNPNYGGMLQAYALTYVTNHFDGVVSEQVTTPPRCTCRKTVQSQLKKALNPLYVWQYISYKVQWTIRQQRTKPLQHNLALRNAALARFEHSVPHSEKVYTADTISQCADYYDLVITGSDQVWNYTWFNPAFFLGFSNARKISYAASIGHSELPEIWKERYRELLKDFSAISVREEEAVEMLQPISPVPVEWVLDPTLLLSASDWDEICAPRQVDAPYLFCYFLGGSERDRKVAEAVAKRKGLKIVTLPHLLGYFRSVDKKFGDVQLWDVSPEQFVSLIKYADFVLTDSFHGSVFSNIYRCPFAVFEREGAKGMSGRLKSLTDLTDTQERFLVTPEMATADYVCALSAELPPESAKMREMREKSMAFLKNNIELLNG